MPKPTTDLGFNDPTVEPVYVEGAPSTIQGVVAAAATNAAATTAGADYTFAWSAATVNHVLLQNNTAAALNYEVDAAATAGSMTLAAGAGVFLDVTMGALHLLTAGVQNVNGTVAGNIVVRAWQ